MEREVYRYRFSSKVPFKDVEHSLLLSMMAAESLHGRSLVRLDASFLLEEEKRACVIDAETKVGRDLARIFTGFVTGEFGDDAFRVERVVGPEGKTEQKEDADAAD